MTRSAPLTKTRYAWAVMTGSGFLGATDHPIGIMTFGTRKEAEHYIASLNAFVIPVRIQITVKLAKVAK